MFTAKNLSTNEENRFESRDQLLFFLDKESVALRSMTQKASFHLEHVDQEGIALENTTVTLPLTESADAFLINFGKAASKTGFHLPKIPLTALNKKLMKWWQKRRNRLLESLSQHHLKRLSTKEDVSRQESPCLPHSS